MPPSPPPTNKTTPKGKAPSVIGKLASKKPPSPKGKRSGSKKKPPSPKKRSESTKKSPSPKGKQSGSKKKSPSPKGKRPESIKKPASPKGKASVSKKESCSPVPAVPVAGTPPRSASATPQSSKQPVKTGVRAPMQKPPASASTTQTSTGERCVEFDARPAEVEPDMIVVDVPCYGSAKDCVNVTVKNKCNSKLMFKVRGTRLDSFIVEPPCSFVEPMSTKDILFQPKPILENYKLGSMGHFAIYIAPAPKGDPRIAKIIWCKGKEPKQQQKLKVGIVLRRKPEKKMKLTLVERGSERSDSIRKAVQPAAKPNCKADVLSEDEDDTDDERSIVDTRPGNDETQSSDDEE